MHPVELRTRMAAWTLVSLLTDRRGALISIPPRAGFFLPDSQALAGDARQGRTSHPRNEIGGVADGHQPTETGREGKWLPWIKNVGIHFWNQP